MVNKKTNSRLAETDFSHYNLREAFIDDQVEYIAALRDEALFSNWGVSVLVRIPLDENGQISDNTNIDEYSNFVDIKWLDTTETVIPKFTEYRQNISEEGMSADGMDALYPLEVLVPTKLFLPRNSRIVFNEYNAREEKIAREWVVLGTVQKQLSNSKTYTRIANCVPARKDLFNATDVYSGTIFFSTNTPTLGKNPDLRAESTIWFIKAGIDEAGLSKGLADGIFEQIPENPSYSEYIDTLLYYSSRPSQIIGAGQGFKEGEVIPVLDENDEQILIMTDKDTQIPLNVIINSVSDKGEILEFELSPDIGYTDFGTEGKEIILKKDSKFPATIKLENIPFVGSIYQESLKPDEILNPKFVLPIEINSVFSARNVALSVLN